MYSDEVNDILPHKLLEIDERARGLETLRNVTMSISQEGKPITRITWGWDGERLLISCYTVIDVLSYCV